MNWLVRLFRRETASTEFIPVIDGLRFIAIVTVVIHHVNGYITTKSEIGKEGLPPGFFQNIFLNGNQGVQLFFVISGFILAYPFIRFHSGKSTYKPTLRQYFTRRLTRLEPPYIISTILIFFLLLLFVPSKFTVRELVESLFASLLYIHNLVIPGIMPRINAVTWSLEIEVQYYILAPLIIWLLWRFRRSGTRRVVQFALIIAFSVLSWMMENYWHVPVRTIAAFMQYFLAGIVLCEIVQLDYVGKYKFIDTAPAFVVGLAILMFLISVEHALSPNIWYKILSPLMIFAFYLIVFYNSWWRKIFSLNAFTLIGGMCYSIYLLHTTVMSFVGRLAMGALKINNPSVYYLVQLGIILCAILVVSAVFFLLIEKPCMKRDWHIKLFNAFKRNSYSILGKQMPNEDVT